MPTKKIAMTPLQEIISIIESHPNFGKCMELSYIYGYCKGMLRKEKEIIVDSYIEGCQDAIRQQYKTPNDYYNTLIKKTEKWSGLA